MDEQRQRIVEDLAGVLRGEIRCDSLTASLYSSDASLYQIMPLGVVTPRDRDDVLTLANYSRETGIPLFARGAGTGLAGEALGDGLIVDFSRHMRDVLSVDGDTVRVQPGVVRDQLNAVLRESGRYFPPDPSNSAVTTIGGMIAVDAAGSHSIRVGSTRDHVKSLECVLADGSLIEFGVESLLELSLADHAAAGDATADDNRHLKRTIVSKLIKILADNRELIDQKQPALIRNCCGYFLRNVLHEDRVNLPRILVGSEGTLALFTEATLHTSPLPEHRGAVLLLFGQLEAAIRTVQAIVGQQPSACDLLDRRLLFLAREADPRFEKLISPAAEAALL
ncbi:MAG: FAD-binding oxidoreductase, partial [Planctomycetes bacterium]|nr:FAD-binding oxidoreductase [Planctomycetota bacterium]